MIKKFSLYIHHIQIYTTNTISYAITKRTSCTQYSLYLTLKKKKRKTLSTISNSLFKVPYRNPRQFFFNQLTHPPSLHRTQLNQSRCERRLNPQDGRESSGSQLASANIHFVIRAQPGPVCTRRNHTRYQPHGFLGVRASPRRCRACNTGGREEGTIWFHGGSPALAQ